MDIVKEFLKDPQNVNRQDSKGVTPIMAASNYFFKGVDDNVSMEIFKEILLNSPNLEIQDHKGYTALALAIHNNPNYNKIKLLIEKGADCKFISSDDETLGWNLLHLYINENDFDNNSDINIVQLLLEQKSIDINAKTKDGKSALYLAALYGNLPAFNLLLENKANIECVVDNKDILMASCIGGNKDIFNQLIEYGFKINVEANDIWKQVIKEILGNHKLEILKSLFTFNETVGVMVDKPYQELSEDPVIFCPMNFKDWYNSSSKKGAQNLNKVEDTEDAPQLDDIVRWFQKTGLKNEVREI